MTDIVNTTDSAAFDLSLQTIQYLLKPEGVVGVAKVSCILRHWGVQLILAYSWTRLAILAVGIGRGGIFLFLLSLHFLSCYSFSLSLSFISSTNSSLSLLLFSGR